MYLHFMCSSIDFGVIPFFFHVLFNIIFFFFFQAEDGIRDYKVTGVQTCALPIFDIQCAAQAIDTLAFFADIDPDSLPLAEKVADWTIQNMQDSDGHFYYRDLDRKSVV